jgi:hypothetical protein
MERLFDAGAMDITLPARVELRAWPQDGTVGGQVAPYGDPVNEWTITLVHARYVAPRTGRRFQMKAYLVDLVGGRTLPDLTRVLLHQVPPVGWWMLKTPTPDDLDRIEQYRVDAPPESSGHI